MQELQNLAENITKAGQGGFSHGFKFSHKKRNFFIQCEQWNSRKNCDPICQKQIQLLKKLKGSIYSSHYYGHIYTKQQNSQTCYILLEDGGKDISEKEWTLKKIKNLIMQICLGLCDLKRKQIVHCDMKPQNILEEKKQFLLVNDKVRLRIKKIIDFGCAQDIQQVNDKEKRLFQYGTPGYYSPQMMNKKALDYKTDIYSLGLILLYLSKKCARSAYTDLREFSEKVQFLVKNKICQNVCKYDKLLVKVQGFKKSFNHRSAFSKIQLQKLTKWMLRHKIQQRPSPEEILKTRFIFDELLDYRCLMSQIQEEHIRQEESFRNKKDQKEKVAWKKKKPLLKVDQKPKKQEKKRNKAVICDWDDVNCGQNQPLNNNEKEEQKRQKQSKKKAQKEQKNRKEDQELKEVIKECQKQQMNEKQKQQSHEYSEFSYDSFENYYQKIEKLNKRDQKIQLIQEKSGRQKQKSKKEDEYFNCFADWKDDLKKEAQNKNEYTNIIKLLEKDFSGQNNEDEKVDSYKNKAKQQEKNKGHIPKITSYVLSDKAHFCESIEQPSQSSKKQVIKQNKDKDDSLVSWYAQSDSSMLLNDDAAQISKWANLKIKQFQQQNKASINNDRPQQKSLNKNREDKVQQVEDQEIGRDKSLEKCHQIDNPLEIMIKNQEVIEKKEVEDNSKCQNSSYDDKDKQKPQNQKEQNHEKNQNIEIQENGEICKNQKKEQRETCKEQKQMEEQQKKKEKGDNTERRNQKDGDSAKNKIHQKSQIIYSKPSPRQDCKNSESLNQYSIKKELNNAKDSSEEKIIIQRENLSKDQKQSVVIKENQQKLNDKKKKKKKKKTIKGQEIINLLQNPSQQKKEMPEQIKKIDIQKQKKQTNKDESPHKKMTKQEKQQLNEFLQSIKNYKKSNVIIEEHENSHVPDNQTKAKGKRNKKKNNKKK